MAPAEVHPTAVVAPGAVLGDGCVVGPYSVIGPEVRVGPGTKIGSHVVVEGRTTLGRDNVIFQFASVGAPPQDLKYRGEQSSLVVGDGNVIREYVTLQPGTAGGAMTTVIGDKNLFMACSHVGHDVVIGSGGVFANSSALAGHVTVGDRVTVGGLVGIHQFVRIGDVALLAAGAMVSSDVPPYCVAQGDRAVLYGLNTVGLTRAGFSPERVRALKKVYRDVFFGPGTMRSRLDRRSAEEPDDADAAAFVRFVRDSSRGVARPARQREDAPEEP